jgi:hypothetical protein
MIPYISPKISPILEKDVEVLGAAFLRLSPLFICLSFFSLTFFVLLVATRTP